MSIRIRCDICDTNSPIGYEVCMQCYTPFPKCCVNITCYEWNAPGNTHCVFCDTEFGEVPILNIVDEGDVPVEEAPADEADVNDPPADEAPVEEAPVDEAPVDEADVNEAPADEAPVEEAPVEEAPVDEADVNEAPVEEAPVDEADVEEAPVEEAPVEEAPVEEADVEEAPVEELHECACYCCRTGHRLIEVLENDYKYFFKQYCQNPEINTEDMYSIQHILFENHVDVSDLQATVLQEITFDIEEESTDSSSETSSVDKNFFENFEDDVSETTTCVICLEPECSAKKKLPCCKNTIHVDCIFQWGKSCPCCRNVFSV